MKQRRPVESFFFKGFDEDRANEEAAEYEEDVDAIDMPESGKGGEIPSDQRISVQQNDQHDGDHAHHIKPEDAFVEVEFYSEQIFHRCDA